MVKKAAQATPNLLLRAARKERGWTQQQVADRIGAPHSLNISRWENGTAFPSAYYLEKLCHLFGKTVRELGLSQLEGVTQGEYLLHPVPAVQMSSGPVQETGQQETTKRDITPVGPAMPPLFELEVVSSTAAEQQDALYPHSGSNKGTLLSPRNPKRSLSSRSDLPAQLTPLIGREREVVTACTLLCSPKLRLLTLVGTAGVGKTRLALQVAAELLDAFADGVYFVPLAPIRDAQFLVSTIVQSIGLTEHGNQTLLDVLKTALQEKHLLLVLDNFEQIVTAAPLLSDLLGACSTLKILVT